MKEVERDLKALLDKLEPKARDDAARAIELTQYELAALCAALRVAIQVERLG